MTQPLTDNQFSENVLNSKGLVLVDFWAEWCGPCRQLGPILEAIDEEMGNDVKIYKMNVDDSPETASQFGIRSIPTMFLFKDGKQVDTKVGLNTQSTISSWIESYK
ncbi:MAG: thioredoxin [Alphaproteobacteria bacterium]|nr:thioredoxin [Alphaproteobacteria bacterium]